MIVQLMMSPNTGVIAPGTVVGKVVVTPFAALVQASADVYCDRLPGPDMISPSEYAVPDDSCTKPVFPPVTVVPVPDVVAEDTTLVP